MCVDYLWHKYQGSADIAGLGTNTDAKHTCTKFSIVLEFFVLQKYSIFDLRDLNISFYENNQSCTSYSSILPWHQQMLTLTDSQNKLLALTNRLCDWPIKIGESQFCIQKHSMFLYLELHGAKISDKTPPLTKMYSVFSVQEFVFQWMTLHLSSPMRYVLAEHCSPSSCSAWLWLLSGPLDSLWLDGQ